MNPEAAKNALTEPTERQRFLRYQRETVDFLKRLDGMIEDANKRGEARSMRHLVLWKMSLLNELIEKQTDAKKRSLVIPSEIVDTSKSMISTKRIMDRYNMDAIEYA